MRQKLAPVFPMDHPQFTIDLGIVGGESREVLKPLEGVVEPANILQAVRLGASCLMR